MTKNISWRNNNQNDTAIVATGFESLKSAKKAVDGFCVRESEKLGGIYLNKIVALRGYAYDDEPGVYYFSTDCITA